MQISVAINVRADVLVPMTARILEIWVLFAYGALEGLL